MHYCPKTLLVEVGAQTNTVQEAKNAVVWTADGRSAAARLLHPDQLLDAEIPPESVISGWVEAQPRLSGLAVCRVISFMYAWKGSGAQNETCSNCLFINISFLTALIVYIHSAMDSPHNMSVS